MRFEYRGPDPNVGPRCDLCLTGPPDKRYPCSTTTVAGVNGEPNVLGVDGTFAVCTACFMQVERSDVDAAAEELLQRAMANTGELGQLHRARFEPWLRRVQAGLLSIITGPAEDWRDA